MRSFVRGGASRVAGLDAMGTLSVALPCTLVACHLPTAISEAAPCDPRVQDHFTREAPAVAHALWGASSDEEEQSQAQPESSDGQSSAALTGGGLPAALRATGQSTLASRPGYLAQQVRCGSAAGPPGAVVAWPSGASFDATCLRPLYAGVRRGWRLPARGGPLAPPSAAAERWQVVACRAPALLTWRC